MRHKSRRLKILITIILIAIIGCVANSYLQRKVFYPLKYYDQVSAQAEKYGLDPLLIMSVIKAESNFKSDAVSHKNAVGLMQITPTTAQWAADEMGLKNYDSKALPKPEINITIGVWFVDYLIDYYDGNTALALAAYNAGTGNVDKWLENDQIEENGDVLTLPYQETTKYLVRINTYHKRYMQLYSKELQR